MKATMEPFDLTQLILSPEQTAQRTEGVHVSHILKTMASVLRKDSKFTEVQLNNLAVVGRLFETVLANALFQPPRYERIGEVEKEGIIGSPDCIDTQDWAVGEFKTTFVSSKGFEERWQYRHYLKQVMAYSYMLEMCRAHLIVLFINGSPPSVEAWQWSLLFTPGELKENWRVLQANVRRSENGS